MLLSLLIIILTLITCYSVSKKIVCLIYGLSFHSHWYLLYCDNGDRRLLDFKMCGIYQSSLLSFTYSNWTTNNHIISVAWNINLHCRFKINFLFSHTDRFTGQNLLKRLTTCSVIILSEPNVQSNYYDRFCFASYELFIHMKGICDGINEYLYFH